jgi:uncharacterized RDD family membrane protein YckC
MPGPQPQPQMRWASPPGQGAPQPQAAPRPPVQPSQQHPPPSYGGWTPVGMVAPLGRRLVAALVDLFVVFFGAIIVHYDSVPVGDGQSVGDVCASLRETYPSCLPVGRTVYASTVSNLIVSPFLIGAVLVMFVLVQGWTGVTLGKLFTGLKVVGPDGRAPGPRRALIRTAFIVVDALPFVVPFLGPLVALCNKAHRRIGDSVADTTVIAR